MLAHQIPDGTERPIAYASRSFKSRAELLSAGKRSTLMYIWSEALLIGHKFELWTGHTHSPPRTGIAHQTAGGSTSYIRAHTHLVSQGPHLVQGHLVYQQ